MEGGYEGDRGLGCMDDVKVTLGNRNDGGGCASMRERSETVKSPGTYVTE